MISFLRKLGFGITFFFLSYTILNSEHKIFLAKPHILKSLTWNPSFIALNLEHAVTEEQKLWGLMNRPSLQDDPFSHRGMLFHFNDTSPRSFWNFNCLIDLDVGFLNANQIITKTLPLKAYPDKMSKTHPIQTLNDFYTYPKDDPSWKFFSENATPKIPCQFVLEVSKNWFEGHRITEGSCLIWDAEDLSNLNAFCDFNTKDQAILLPTWDITDQLPSYSQIKENKRNSILLKLPSNYAHLKKRPLIAIKKQWFLSMPYSWNWKQFSEKQYSLNISLASLKEDAQFYFFCLNSEAAYLFFKLH